MTRSNPKLIPQLSQGLIGLLIFFAPVALIADDQPSPRLGLLGNDECVWIYDHIPDLESGSRLLSFGLRRKEDGRFRMPRSMKRLVGRVHRTTLVGNDLHVFFDEGTHRSYRFGSGPTQGHAAIGLPEGDKPFALAGDSSTQSLYALVAVTAADAILQIQIQRARDLLEAQQPGEDVEAGPIDFAITLENARFGIARYSASQWEVICPLPKWFDAQQECHMTVDIDGHLHILFAEDQAGRYLHSQYFDGQWLAPTVAFKESNSRVLSLSAVGENVLAITRTDSDSSASVFAVSFDGSQWTRNQPLITDALDSHVETTQLTATLFNHSIALAWRGQHEQLMFGRWSVEGGPPIEPASEIVDLGVDKTSLLSLRLQSVIGFLALALLMFFVFWRRRDSIIQAAELPAHYAVASYWRRAAAFVMDLAPPAMLTVHQWNVPLLAWFNEVQELEAQGEHTPPLSDELLLGWGIACAAYVLYCSSCEALFATTPGKLAVQCRVVAENGHRCRFSQILLRNILRFIELFPLFQLWPSLILILLTRNHQRLGDLIARTIVVEKVSTSRTRMSGDMASRDKDQPPPSD